MADVAAGLLASAIIGQVGAKIGSAIGDQVSMLCCFKDDMEDMKETLKAIGATMKDAEKRSIKEEEVRLWMKRLKNAALDISDMWDELHDNSKPTNDGKVKEIFSCLNISPKIIMANKMKKMRDQLRKIEEDHRNFKLESDPRVDNQHQFAHRETTSDVPKGIFSRDNERRRVIASLSVGKDKEGITILPIFGLDGIGKTTLAQLVFNDIHFKDYDHRVWVYVSQAFDLLKIGNTIIYQVLKEERHIRDMESINQLLRELLGDKKALIVLDDLWEGDDFQLNKLKCMLNVSSQMKVLVTTRENQIANKICTIAPCELIRLEDTVCWDFIKHNTNFESRDDQQQLEEIGRVIAGKCGGVPLAAQALGFMLSRMNLNQWEAVSNSDIWNEPYAENSVLPSLKLTYIAMPPHLRMCFAYCAIFPRGHIIAKESLIHQWIALDFIEPSNMFSDTLLGEEYVGQLLGMSFLQHSKLSMTTDKGSALTMHDLVYDLARTVMKEELVVYNANKVISMADRKYCRYALLTNCCKPLKISTILPTKLRALLFHDCRQLGLRGTTFSFAKCLRVLDLTESSFIKFPDSIGHLKQLRFLIAPGMENQRFPDCITELSKLKYLEFSGPNISAIPESIGKLDCLVHLDLSGCYALQELPETLCDLTKLQYINLSRCCWLRGLPQDLGNLRELQYLNLSNCKNIEKLPKSFGKLTNLMHLDLKECSGVSNKDVLNGLNKLWYLNLSGCFGVRASENIDYICTLTNLEHLDLSINGFHSLPECIGHLRRLRTFDLSDCRRLNSVPESIASLDNLELLLMDGCSRDFKEAIRRYHFKRIPLPHFVVHPEDGGGCSNLHKLADVNPDELEISCLENVMTLEEAQGVGLRNKENPLKLSFHWGKKAGALEDSGVLGELVPPRGLEHLKIEGYRSSSFPKWIMSISDYLPNIASVVLQDLPACSILPPLGQLPELKELSLARLNSIRKITGDLRGGQRAFLQLSRFILEDMEVLEEWNTTYFGEDGTEEFMFPVLHELVVDSCPRLRLKPCPPIFHSWKITGSSDEVLNSGEEGDDNFGHFNSSARRTKLSVNSIPWYRGGWRLLHHLPTLRELYITNVDMIASLPESMRQLASLRLLRLSYCSDLSIVPEWLGDLKSLEVLCIWGCRRITSLPSSIQQLTNLQKLEISDDNRSLTEWSQSKENKMKLAHIKQITFIPITIIC